MEKAFSTYYGGKFGAGVSQQIINEIRPHDVYMELFLGNGAVYRLKKPAKTSVLNDLDPVVVREWNRTGIDVSNLPAVELLRSYSFQPGLRYCIYLDPPYPISSRRTARPVYNCEMTDEDHRELLKVVCDLPANVDVLLSTYENPVYADYLVDWRLKTFTGQTRNGPAVEYLYMNFQNPDGLLHDYRYLGNDFTERQRIKRKISREVDKLNRLPPAERNAIINEVLTNFSIDDFARA
ncbi:DNA adenine methylase [Spirosoma pomorum]